MQHFINEFHKAAVCGSNFKIAAQVAIEPIIGEFLHIVSHVPIIALASHKNRESSSTSLAMWGRDN